MSTRAIWMVASFVAATASAQAPTPEWWLAPVSLLADEPHGEDYTVADVDGDGRVEVLTLHEDQSVRIHTLVRGGLPGWTRIDPVGGMRKIAALDLDLDGDIDVALAGGGRAVALLQGADGTWESRDLFEGHESVGSRQLTQADVNGDGHPDLSLNDDARHVVLASPAPQAVRRLTAQSYTQWSTRFADFDGDGDVDGVAMQDGVPWLLRNDGQLPFTEVQLPLATQGRSLGFAQVVGATPGAELLTSLDQGLRVAPNLAAGGGTYGAWGATAVESVYEMAFVDVEGDGDLDILGTAGDYRNVGIFLENTDGAGTFAQTLEAGAQLGRGEASGDSVAVGDLDGDGIQDLVRATPFRVPFMQGLRRAVVTLQPRRWNRSNIQGGATLVIDLESAPLAQYEGAVRLTGLELVAGTLGESAPPSGLFTALEVYLETTGDDRWSEADARVGAVSGDVLQSVTLVPLDDVAGLDIGASRPRLYAVGRVARRAHTLAADLRFAAMGATARFGGAPVPVGLPLPFLARWGLTNDPPVATADALVVAEGAETALDVLANDEDPDGDPLHVELLGLPEHGALSIGDDGVLRYQHDGSEAPLEDAFSYRATDGRDASEEVLVALTIRPTNDPPVAQPDDYEIPEDGVLTVARDLGVLANDADVDSFGLVARLATPPAHGELELRPDGGFVYRPEPDFAGADGFAYRPDDGEAQGAPVAVTLTVHPRNDPPISNRLLHQTRPNTPVELLLVAQDPDGGQPWLFVDTLPDHGRLAGLRPPDGRVVYWPPRDFSGEARFTVRFSDGRTLSDSQLVRIRVE